MPEAGAAIVLDKEGLDPVAVALPSGLVPDLYSREDGIVDITIHNVRVRFAVVPALSDAPRASGEFLTDVEGMKTIATERRITETTALAAIGTVQGTNRKALELAELIVDTACPADGESLWLGDVRLDARLEYWSKDGVVALKPDGQAVTLLPSRYDAEGLQGTYDTGNGIVLAHSGLKDDQGRRAYLLQTDSGMAYMIIVEKQDDLIGLLVQDEEKG